MFGFCFGFDLGTREGSLDSFPLKLGAFRKLRASTFFRYLDSSNFSPSQLSDLSSSSGSSKYMHEILKAVEHMALV